jgi:hypothetical protein
VGRLIRKRCCACNGLPSRVPEATTAEAPPAPYGISNIVADGCFQPPERLEAILQRWHDKKNLILQSPPGTGKT